MDFSAFFIFVQIFPFFVGCVLLLFQMDGSVFEELFPEQFRFFSDIIDKRNISGAYLFWGREGIGKTSFAVFFARSALCGIMPPCTFCDSCGYEQHPDILVVRKSQEDERLKAELVREAIRFSHVPPIFGKRFIIISHAHLMTSQGFSALLKTIEEPKPFSTFILVSEKIDVIPPTIISRCIKVKFTPSKPTLEKLIRRKIKEKFGEFPRELEDVLVMVSSEKPSIIDRISSEDELKKLWSMVKLFFVGMSDGKSRLELFEMVLDIARERDKVRLFLDFLEAYVSANMQRFGQKSVFIWDKLKDARRKIELFINPRVVLTELIL